MRFTLYVTYLFLGGSFQMIAQTSSVHVRQNSSFIVANIGDNVTLQCFYKDSATMFYWYKQSLGGTPKLMSSFYRHEKSGIFVNEFKNIPRLRLDVGNGKNHLTIYNLDISDSATYYCTGSYEYDFEFVEGATVSVKGSGSTSKVLVRQSDSETTMIGDSETLDCTIHTGTHDGEHSFYWFRNSGEHHPGLIYAHGGGNNQSEIKPDPQTHTCVYNLPMKSQKPSDALSHCAVVSCGQILFGRKKKLDTEHKSDPFVLVHFLIGALAFTTMLAVLLAYTTRRVYKGDCCHCADSGTSATLTANVVDNQDTDSIHYAALRVQKANNRSTRHRNDVQSECVYSIVRQ
ncbi:uncharacterized protein LOC117807523 [Xyrichtys novacula]|uniref:Uncharacterized protein LOC117807523 n=1 Tax=Xyrichtys novacula TaxID=13765 RepID=A0AAV1HNB1_XYRNO|nr:uncharacterized protein LOC117807523 [Xyrichtys novacula]